MKKILFMIIGIIVLYSCKKEITEPEQQLISNTTIDTRCQDSGICLEGTYQAQYHLSGVDTFINKTNSNTLGTIRVKFIKYQHHPVFPNHKDSLKYSFEVIDFNNNYLSTDTNYTHLFWSKGGNPEDITYTVWTKTGKKIAFKFIYK